MIETRTLTDGGQHAADIARVLSDFLSAALRSLDIAIYDFSLKPETAPLVVDAIRGAAQRGVEVRVVYNVDHGKPIAVPPPPIPRPDLIASLGVPSKAISGVPDLMHHKYVVRDGTTVWTGSTNWTDDAWTREENVVITIESPEITADYARDFESLWSSGRVQDSGHFTAEPHDVGGVSVLAMFSPGGGRRITRRIAGAVHRAQKRVRVCSPVITAGPILGALAEVATDGKVDLSGVCDATQMHEVLGQWHANPESSWKTGAFLTLVSHASFAGKRSTPYAPGSIHDYMHAKITVADDVVFIGSYNLSHSGQDNAENVCEIHDARLAESMATFIDQVHERYPRAEFTSAPTAPNTSSGSPPPLP